MEQSETTVRSTTSKDEEIRKMLEEKREARKVKLMMRLGRNQSKPLSMAAAEAITGTLRNKKPATTTNASQEVASSNQPKAVKAEAPKQAVKSSLSFRQTATSEKRANPTTQGALPKKPMPPTKKVSVGAKRPATAGHPIPAAHARLQKQKLTVPHSPKFSVRPQRVAPIVSRPATAPVSLKSHMAAARQTTGKTTKPLVPAAAKKTSAVDKINGASTVKNKRNSTAWTVPASPKRAEPVKETPFKPFIRKSLSESKAARSVGPSKQQQQLARSVSSAKPRSSTLVRKSVAPPSTLSRSSSIRVQKEPSQEEKVKQWLEKRGRSIASCRHLSCLGHQLKDFPTPERKPASRSSIRKSIKPTAAVKVDTTNSASPALKRNTSVLNTTFEKEDDEEEQSVPAPPPPFKNEAEDEDASATAAVESEDKFLTPAEEKPVEESLPAGNTMEDTLKVISALFQDPAYPSDKIESWIDQTDVKFPGARLHALYWDLKARLEERRGNAIEALDIYSEALANKAEPLDLMNQLFTEFQLRVGSTLPMGQRTPLLKSFGVDTPMIQRSRRMNSQTPRRPLLDSTQVFQSTAVKFELRLKEIFNDAEAKENYGGAVSKRKSHRATPIKFNVGEKVSVPNDKPYHLVATPVRRSMRHRSTRSTIMPRVEEQTLCVDDLDELSPTTKSRTTLRKNVALFE